MPRLRWVAAAIPEPRTRRKQHTSPAMGPMLATTAAYSPPNDHLLVSKARLPTDHVVEYGQATNETFTSREHDAKTTTTPTRTEEGELSISLPVVHDNQKPVEDDSTGHHNQVCPQPSLNGNVNLKADSEQAAARRTGENGPVRTRGQGVPPSDPPTTHLRKLNESKVEGVSVGHASEVEEPAGVALSNGLHQPILSLQPANDLSKTRSNLSPFVEAQNKDINVLLDHDPTVDEPPRPTPATVIQIETQEPPFFVEELSGRYNNPNVPLPPPPPLPPKPLKSAALWVFDEEQRVLTADFSKCESISSEDKAYLGLLMERDDIVVVSRGLCRTLDEKIWNMDTIMGSFWDEPYPLFRKFQRSDKGDFHEVNGSVSMRVKDFYDYLKRKFSKNPDRFFSFTDAKEVVHRVNVDNVVFYMIDVDVPTFLPRHFANFVESCKLPEILPGGQWCMMHPIPIGQRPFMGPNLYCTPGGSFTQLHQDGHGTVDSGHFCLFGLNEVVMLRRLPECHKRQAVSALKGSSNRFGSYDPMYGLPHDDLQANRPNWPTMSTIKEWKRMNYCPSVFILKPGEHVHIGKGRLHAFRKLSRDMLSSKDCHYYQRLQALAELPRDAPLMCFSIAHDWMYRGTSLAGINREVVATMEAAAHCRKKRKKCLAIPESSIIEQAKILKRDSPTDQLLARGILPSLRHIVDNQCRAASSQQETFGVPDTHVDASIVTIDPRGSDFYCRICHHEIVNIYFHCEGCEYHLCKDFNICAFCYADQAFAQFFPMHPRHAELRRSDVNHTGVVDRSQHSKFCGSHAATCDRCHRCRSCDCNCHATFSGHFRFMDMATMNTIVTHCENVAADVKLEYEAETKVRLEALNEDPSNSEQAELVTTDPSKDVMKEGRAVKQRRQ